MRRLLPAIPLLLAGCASARPAPAVPGTLPMKYVAQPTEGAITPRDLMSRLYVFADDSMLGREAGTIGNVRATAWVAREMQRMGLEPAGENGSWFQSVPLTTTRLDTTKALAAELRELRVGKDVLPLHPARLGARWLPQGYTTRTVDRARVIYGGELGGELIDPARTAQKVVLFTLPADSAGRRDWRFWMQGPLTQYRDAVGIAIAGLDVVPAPNAQRYLAPMQRVRDEPPGTAAPLVLLVSTDVARHLLGGAATLEGLTVGIEGRSLRGNLAFTETPAPYPVRNVIGVLPGRDARLRGQYVAVGAHNDHVGTAERPLDHDSVLANNMVIRRQGVQDPARTPTREEATRIAQLRDSLRRAHPGPVRRDSVFNGADHDGSGTVAMLEIAEHFASRPAALRPRRSLLFVSHTGEEYGLWGSQWFTDHPTVPRDSIVAQLNMDMVGRGKATDVMGRGPNNVQLIGPRRLSTQLGDVIDSVNARRAVKMDLDLSFDANGHPLNRYCRSDHYMYARYGIPITYFSLGYHTDYHQVTDEPQYIDYAHMARIAGFVGDIAEAVADREERLVVDRPKPDPAGGCRQ